MPDPSHARLAAPTTGRRASGAHTYWDTVLNGAPVASPHLVPYVDPKMTPSSGIELEEEQGCISLNFRYTSSQVPPERQPSLRKDVRVGALARY